MEIVQPLHQKQIVFKKMKEIYVLILLMQLDMKQLLQRDLEFGLLVVQFCPIV